MNAPVDSRSPLARAAAAVMVCNPFLLLSPMFLLYGIYRAVIAPNIFKTDTGNIIFNFTALGLYVLTVCVTSTLLARKRIMPDTMMLLILHALLFVAPFILIAHGVFLDGSVGLLLGAGGISCGLLQLFILRKRLTETFCSPQLFIGGAVLLFVNFAAPLLFRRRLENNNEAWTMAGAYAWNVLLPLLVAWINLLPNRAPGQMLWSRTWFSFVTYLLWLAGTVVQLWTVAYVDDRALHPHQFTVALWVLAWTALRRADDLPERCAEIARKLAPAGVFLIPAAGAISGLDLNIACALFALNVPLLLLKLGRMPAFALAGLSLIAAMSCVPLNWMQAIVPSADRTAFIALCVISLIVGALAYMRDSRAGFLGSIGAGILTLAASDSGTLALNAAVLFLFLHQLRWPALRRDEQVLLTIAGLIWLTQSFSVEISNPTIRFAPFVATIVATLCLRNASLQLPTSLIPPIGSIIVLLMHPIHRAALMTAKAPSGAIAILLGFALLAAGAWHALRKTTRNGI